MSRKDLEHVKKIIDSKFNRRPASTKTLRKNCSKGYVFTTETNTSKWMSEFHHALPIQTLGSAFLVPEDEVDFFHNCMALTEWDINEEVNLIGLPTRKVYKSFLQADFDASTISAIGAAATDLLSAERNQAARAGKAGIIPDLPCHKNDHHAYNAAVITYLQDYVWIPLAEKKESGECKISGEGIREILVDTSELLLEFLETRGREHQGASHCWVHRNDDGIRDIWYIPLSLDPDDPTPIPPPPDWTGVSNEKKKEWLKSLFSSS